jgi:hypothetical protein
MRIAHHSGDAGDRTADTSAADSHHTCSLASSSPAILDPAAWGLTPSTMSLPRFSGQ